MDPQLLYLKSWTWIKQKLGYVQPGQIIQKLYLELLVVLLKEYQQFVVATHFLSSASPWQKTIHNY